MELPGWLGREPRGNGRDLYWCWLANEPMLPSFSGPRMDRFTCTACRHEEPTDVPSAAFLTQHTFLFHVFAPRTVAEGGTG